VSQRVHDGELGVTKTSTAQIPSPRYIEVVDPPQSLPEMSSIHSTVDMGVGGSVEPLPTGSATLTSGKWLRT